MSRPVTNDSIVLGIDRFLVRHQSDPELQATLREATGILAAHLREPEGELPFIWSASDPSSDAFFDLSGIQLLISAWSVLAPSVAADLIRNVVTLMGNDGELVSAVFPVGRVANDAPISPRFIQSVRTYWLRTQDSALVDEILPSLQLHLRWLRARLGPDQPGILREQRSMDDLAGDYRGLSSLDDLPDSESVVEGPHDIQWAARVVAANSPAPAPEKSILDQHRMLKWMDSNRRAIATWAAILLGLPLLAATAYYLLKPTLTTSSLETSVGFAQRLYSEGKFQEAEQVLLGVKKRGNRAYAVEYSLGLAQFRLQEWDAAEASFRLAMQLDSSAPKPAYNLAVTLHQKGTDLDAAMAYRNFLNRFSKAYPDLAARAQTALMLLKIDAPPEVVGK